MNYIYYQTKTQFTNTGDVLINKALIESLRKYGKLRCNCEKEISKEFIQELEIKEDEKVVTKNVFSLFGDILKQAIKAKKNGDKVYIVSGLGHKWGGNFKINLKNMVAGIVSLFYKILGIKIVRIGMSIGPITNGLAIAEKFRSLFTHYYYVRDTKSYELCKKIGIKKVELCPDMSWIYLIGSSRVFNASNIVTVSLRESILNENNDIYKDEMFKKCGDILERIEKSMNQKIKVVFLYQVKQDKEFCKKAYELFSKKYDCEFLEEQINLFTAPEIYGKSILNISNRLHSILLGYKYGSLPIALIDTENHIKISQTLKDCELSELIVDVYNGKEEEIRNIVENKERLYKKLVSVENEKKAETIRILDKIFSK